MPTYEFEMLTAINSPTPPCPLCGGSSRRLVGAGAFILKGSGAYSTDYWDRGNGEDGGTDPQ